MTAQLNSLFRAISPLWEMSLTAAYAAAVVALLRLILKKRAPRQVLCVLWLVVFARLLIPVSLESPVSIVPDAQQVQLAQERLAGLGQGAPAQKPAQNPAQNPAQGQTPGVTANPVSQGNAAHDPALSAPGGTLSPAAPAAPREEAPAGFPWQALIAGVWLAGALAMGGYGLLSYAGLRRRLFDAIRAQDGAWEHPAVGSPFILGVVRPRIYLPAGLRGMPRQFILCHERAHLRRGDHIVKPLCWLALAIHWFNPAVWLAFILMSRDIEAACDEAVIRRLGPKVKADYSATLLSLATGGRLPAPCPLAFDEGDAKGRIKNVLRYRRPALWIVVVSVLAAVLAAVCLLTDPVSAEPPEDGGPDPDASASQSQPPEQGLNALLDPWMVEVLDGERSFRSGSEEYRIDQLRAMVYGDEFPELILKAGKLTVMDLDKDGVNELVVWPAGGDEDTPEIGYTVGYFIFRRQGDTVYGYNPGSRLCNTLKADGTFSWAGSSYYWGFGSARFTENGFEIENITWCDATGDGEQYFVNGLKATQEEFDAATGWGEQNRKPEPTWYVYEGGVLKPYRPDNMKLAAQTGDRDSGEAKLWLEGGEIPWLEWNGATTRLDGLITPGQMPFIYCWDFDGDGQDEVVVTWYINGYAQYDLYEWEDGGPVLRTTYDSQQMLVRFNKNNVAGVGPYGDGGEYGLTVTYAHVEGEDTPDSTDFYRHYVTGRCVLPAGFFDGYEHIRDGYPHAYANGFRLVYLQRDTGKFYFDFDVYLADETMQELDYVDTLLGDPPYSEYADHYMLDKAVGVCGFYLSYDGTEWMLEEFNQVTMDYPGDPAVPPEIMPEPSPEPSSSPAPTVCEHGLDNAVYDFSGGSLVIRCELDGTGYPVPIITENNWILQYHRDLDGDGHIEHLFSRMDASLSRNEGILYVVDVQDGALNTYSFDPGYLADDFNDTVTYEFVDEYQAMNFTYQGYEMQVDLSEQWSAMMNHGRSYYPLAYAPETFYSFDGEDIDMMIPIYLEHGFGGHICYLSWSHLRYTGSGFQLASSSFGYRTPQ